MPIDASFDVVSEGRESERMREQESESKSERARERTNGVEADEGPVSSDTDGRNGPLNSTAVVTGKSGTT